MADKTNTQTNEQLNQQLNQMAQQLAQFMGDTSSSGPMLESTLENVKETLSAAAAATKPEDIVDANTEQNLSQILELLQTLRDRDQPQAQL